MNETDLVAGIKNGEPAAVQEMISLYGDRLLRSAYLLCGSEIDAQDLVQDTLVVAVREADRFRGKSALYTWLHGILLNLTRRYHRKRKRIVYTDTVPEPPPPSDPPPCSPLDVNVASIALSQAIQKLSLVHREVVILRYFEGMRIKDIARCAHAGTGTIKSRLHYALRRLRELIPDELNVFRPDGTQGRRKP